MEFNESGAMLINQTIDTSSFSEAVEQGLARIANPTTVTIGETIGRNIVSQRAPEGILHLTRGLNSHVYEQIFARGPGVTVNGNVDSLPLVQNFQYNFPDYTVLIIFLVGVIFLATRKYSTSIDNSNIITEKDAFTDADITKSLEDRCNFTVSDKDYTDADITKYFANKDAYMGISDNSLDNSKSTDKDISDYFLDIINSPNKDYDVQPVFDFSKSLDIHSLHQIFSDLTMSNSDIILVFFITSLTSIFWLLILKLYVMKNKI